MPAGSFAVSVKPAVLKWARETSGYSLPEVAQRCRKTEPEVAAWEAGKQRPTWAGLRRLAKIYRRPVVSLLLPAPPKEEPVPPDFRTLPKASKRLSPKTLFAIRTARWLAQTAADLEQQLGVPAAFQGPPAHPSMNPESLAEHCRDQLGVSLEAQTGWKSPQHAFNEWRRALEAQNVFVFQFRLDDEVDGFSLLHHGRPVIVLNPSSVTSRRIFTVFHEYAHLLLKHPGICLPEEGLQGTSKQIETFCNQFAAAFLVPKSDFAHRRPDINDERSVDLAARRYYVSRFVVLGRMRTLGTISQQTYLKIANRWQARGRPTAPKKIKGGPTRVARCLSERGRRMASLVLEASKRELITVNDATAYLGIKMPDLTTLETKVA